jgi:O-antigen ligase
MRVESPYLGPPGSSLALVAAMWAAGWLVPIHEPPWLAFHADLLAASGLALLVVLTLRWSDAPIDMPLSAAAATLLALVPPLQAAGGLILFGGDAWMASLYLLGFAVAATCGHWVAGRQMGADLGLALAVSLLVVGTLSSVMALWQWLQWAPPMPWWRPAMPGHRPGANLGQSNMLATLLVLALLSALALHQASRARPVVVGAVVAILVPGIAVTQSRTGLLALIVAVVWLWAKRRSVGQRLQTRWLIALLIWLLLCVALQPWLGQWAQLPLGRPALDVGASARLVHWATMLRALQESPWLGYGWNQVAVAQASVPGLRFSGEFIEHSHNLLLDLLVWNGLPLGLFLIAGLLWWSWHRARHCCKPSAVFLLAGVWVLMVHSMTEYPLDYFGYLMLLGLLVGAVDAAANTAENAAKAAGTEGEAQLAALRQRTQVLRISRHVAAAVALLTASMAAWVTVEYTALEADHALMRQQWEQPDLVTAGPEAVPRVVLLTNLRALLVFMRLPLGPGMPPAQQDFMDKVAKRYGYAPVLVRQAIALARNGQTTQAQAVLTRLCQTKPKAVCEQLREQVKAQSSPSTLR